jgi:hypothetical protein
MKQLELSSERKIVHPQRITCAKNGLDVTLVLPENMDMEETPVLEMEQQAANYVLQTPTHLRAAGLRRAASATQVVQVRMGAHAHLVWQASTRQALEAPHAQIVQPASLPQQLGQHQIRVATAAQAQSQEQVLVHARIVTTANPRT